MNQMKDNQPKRYLEYELIKIRGKEEKHLTERGSVSIDDRTAMIMNKQSNKTKLLYELESGDDSEKDLLLSEAKNLGIKTNATIGVDKLKAKLSEFRDSLLLEAIDLEIIHEDDINTIDLQNKINEAKS